MSMSNLDSFRVKFFDNRYRTILVCSVEAETLVAAFGKAYNKLKHSSIQHVYHVEIERG